MPESRIIKKYPNRRLYDTEISSYITLEEVRQLVVDGEKFEVRDAKTGEDLTRSVLLQIITEHEDSGQPMFTTQLLSQVIRFYGDSMQGFMGSYLEKSLQVFLDQQQQFRSQLNNIMGRTPWSMLNDLTERNMDAWRSVQQGFLNDAVNKARQGEEPQKAKRKASPDRFAHVNSGNFSIVAALAPNTARVRDGLRQPINRISSRGTSRK